MTEVLLEELFESDIEWMIQRGRRHHVSAHQFLIQQGQTIDKFYVLLEGSLVATIADRLASDPEVGQTLIQFTEGDVLGETAFLRSVPSAIAIQSQDKAVVLELPYALMQTYLSQDPAFAARFYRAIAILLQKRFEQVLNKFSRRRGLQISPMQDGPVLFGELQDRDVDWMVEQGEVKEAHADQVLIQVGHAVEKLYVVLYGTLSLAMVESKRNDLNEIFSQIRGDSKSTGEATGRQIAHVGKGAIVGETALLNSRSNFTVKAREPSLLLALPRSQLSLKLQQEPTMGARFYRLLALLIAQRLDALVDRLSYKSLSYRAGQPLSSNVQYEDELDLDAINALNLGGARFDWMLQRLKVRGT